MMAAQGSVAKPLTTDAVENMVAQYFAREPLTGQRVLVIIPDGTRSAPMPLLFRVLQEEIGGCAARLDFLIALGTHAPMSEAQIAALVGMDADTRCAQYPNCSIWNHAWADPHALETVGVITGEEMAELSDGQMTEPTPVQLNRLLHAYDLVVLCGPVFPHEVAGYSGGFKYLVPGVAGAEIIHATHWLGALATSMATIGIADTPVRRVIHRAAEFVRMPMCCIALVMSGHELVGMFIGETVKAWRAAAEMSSRINVIWVEEPYRSALAMPSSKYTDLWTAAKAMYKTEPAIADGGEVIIYAPELNEVSGTHHALIERVGYHVRDYFVKQPERFADVPGGIKAHSTHVKGAGCYDERTGVETPRIRVTLATGISRAECLRLNLGYADWRELDVNEWRERAGDSLLLVENAGEQLYRIRGK